MSFQPIVPLHDRRFVPMPAMRAAIQQEELREAQEAEDEQAAQAGTASTLPAPNAAAPTVEQRRGPTAEHWRAVRVALQKFLGLGPYSGFQGRVLPHVEFQWDELPPNVNGQTEVFPDGRIIVRLASDRSPVEVHATCLHELEHCYQAGQGQLQSLPRAVVEEHAERAAVRLAALWW